MTPGGDGGVPAIGITDIAIASAFGGDAQHTWEEVRRGNSAVHPSSRFGGVLMAEVDDGKMIDALLAGLDERGVPPGTGIALGTSVAPGQVPPGRSPYDLLPAAVEAFGLRGPRASFATGCVAGAHALCRAVDVIRSGRAPAMLVAGVEMPDRPTLEAFRGWRATDDAPMSPYSRSAGTNLGGGGAVLVLTADPAAERVIAYVGGYGLASDAAHVTAPAADGEGLARAMAAALHDAGRSPAEVDYVNGHGTGTRANDQAELNAMGGLFARPGPPLSSLKPQIGHTLGASPVLEAALTAYAVRDQWLPPTINVDPGGDPDWDIVPGVSRPARLDVALTNSLAFGGMNCSIVLGRSPGAHPASPARRVRFARVARVPDQDAARGLVPRRFAHRLDDLALRAVAAAVLARQAVEEPAGGVDPRRIGLVFATSTGPARSRAAFEATLGEGRDDTFSPVATVNGAVSVVAGYISLSLRIQGPIAVIGASAADATVLEYASGFLRTGRADVVLVVHADEGMPATGQALFAL
ncbi:beta-ketoacyl synthase N-terminal-like domain-containing protein [Actinoplanes sp. NBRC 103695]|uniref:beta-ketoacyl synthase N-terminal-like domain-containing protein n=1 Tax=Actinoplanes sp. NBRC 103695 TaxID=3032202 RepID=UPI0024A395DA|nr:beta-ketoacyl synthase N-terminal-like domain-containing protein [Actinoplanes sp. NBRC 103695]GLY98698.1 hypothetical protein Acsp02_59520 [Actinoplanes sp. NBRC 103695]